VRGRRTSALPERETPDARRSALAVTDTHTLLWYANRQSQKLGVRARAHFERTEKREAAIFVPTFVLAEIGELVHLGKIRLPQPFEQWLDDLLGTTVYIPADLTSDVVRCAQTLFAIPERGDRLIAATALSLDLPLMTRDAEIANCAQVSRLWD
jgi:PIN domain nuclease of toxin-antitoxin system